MLLPKTASPAEAKISRHIKLDGSDLKGKIDQRMQRHPNQRKKNERLEQASPRRPVSRGIFFIIANPHCNSSEKEQRPQSTAHPTPFQRGLQIIFMQEPPRAGNLVNRPAIVRGKYDAKRSWPEPEKADVREGANCYARGHPTSVF